MHCNIQKAQKLSPEDPAVLFNAALVYNELGDLRRAKILLGNRSTRVTLTEIRSPSLDNLRRDAFQQIIASHAVFALGPSRRCDDADCAGYLGYPLVSPGPAAVFALRTQAGATSSQSSPSAPPVRHSTHTLPRFQGKHLSVGGSA